jgi:hypothetical protein
MPADPCPSSRAPIDNGWAVVRQVLEMIAALTGLLAGGADAGARPATLPRPLWRRALRWLRPIERLARRLVLVRALAFVDAPLADPRPGKRRAAPLAPFVTLLTSCAHRPAPIAPLPRARLAMLPATRLSGAASGFSRARPGAGAAASDGLAARLAALAVLLADPDPAARRLAKLLRRRPRLLRLRPRLALGADASGPDLLAHQALVRLGPHIEAAVRIFSSA